MKRLAIMDALKAALQAAFPGASVEYWRDRPIVRDYAPAIVVFRDIGGAFQKTGHEHEHRVRVEVEVFSFTSPLGNVLNEQLDKLILAIGTDPSLGQRQTIVELVAFAYDTLGDGFESCVCKLSIDVVYRTKAWEGV